MTALVKKPHFLFRFAAGPYNILLCCMILLFIFRPYGRGDIYPGMWKTLLTATLIFGAYRCGHRYFVKVLLTILAIPAVLSTWIDLFRPSETAEVVLVSSTALFLLICAGSIIYDVVLKAKVAKETLLGIVCAYFLISFIFAYLYLFIEYMDPGSIAIRSKVVPVFPHAVFLSEMLYFSFVTLLKIGYGDILALKDISQTLAVLEGIVGEFYIAILVARIVAVYSLFSKKIAKN